MSDKTPQPYLKFTYIPNPKIDIDLPGELVDEESLRDFEKAFNEAFSTRKFPEGTCPKCGDRGKWIMLGCFCRNGHGQFMG
jgi:hypothetical protein